MKSHPGASLKGQNTIAKL